MKSADSKVILLLLTSLVLLFNSCKKSPTEPGNGSINSNSSNIKTGSAVQVTSTDISSSGGTINISKPGSPVNGMVITVPSSALSDTRTFSVSYAPITSHLLGVNFNPITPMIMIKNGGGYASDMITIKVQIKKSSDEFAMGFLYNEATGKIEGLPLLDLTDSSITVGTRQLAASSISLGKRTSGQDLNNQQAAGQ